ncbi:MAG: glucan biosynthesis protein [Proteobacteria bacterium]|nr:glucan biosynthesis protein [Pseudomonadota bacterium]MBS0574793.1 glucan biosynthesis protein [Pseudomonadota bacterium]
MTGRLGMRNEHVSRRAVLTRGVALGALLTTTSVPTLLLGQTTSGEVVAPQPTPFDFNVLTAMMQQSAKGASPAPVALPDFLAKLTYDEYKLIQFAPSRTRWADPGMDWHLVPFHVGWLFKEPVLVYEVADGKAMPMTFTTSDFEYRHQLAQKVPANFTLPGVAGVKLYYPLNRPDIFDEVISFVGASYFRALGRDNAYGMSSRGLAINTGLSTAEEFPKFTAFWMQRPAPGEQTVTVYAALDSASVTGAYRFVVTPGADTTVEVTARIFFRAAVDELGIAPLTSMFLFSDNNRSRFDDYRKQVHDSDGLRIVKSDGDVIWRPLNNPLQLASSYFEEKRPLSFGLMQRERSFEAYEDDESHYERRPSVVVEPIGDWGAGAIRLVEIPSDLETHDNIVAYWVPEKKPAPGDMLEVAYRLHWGRLPVADGEPKAVVTATRAGIGGAAGLDNPPDTRKFAIDFQGGLLGRLPGDNADIKPVVTVTNGTAEIVTLHKIDGADIWRLVMDIASEQGAVCELSAHVAGYEKKLSEIWMCQWVKP